MAIGINILAIRRVDFLEKYIATDKTTYSRIKIPTFEIIQPRFLIEHIPAIPKRLHLAQRFRQLTGTPQRRAPRIVAVAESRSATDSLDKVRIRHMEQFFLLLRKFLLPARRRLVRGAQDATGREIQHFNIIAVQKISMLVDLLVH